MHLIDCEDMVIVKATQEMRWLALSYVWGVNLQTQDHPGYHGGSRVSLDIPRTVRDALSVTLQLGYRYLWVDEYCIEQDNEVHRNDQISKMDQIYRVLILPLWLRLVKAKHMAYQELNQRNGRIARLFAYRMWLYFRTGLSQMLKLNSPDGLLEHGKSGPALQVSRHMC
jgi:hypothetical protein